MDYLNPELIAYIVTVALAIISSVFGKKYIAYKDKAVKFAAALEITVNALEDDKITPKEAHAIAKSWREILNDARFILRNK